MLEKALEGGIDTPQVLELCGILYEEKGELEKAQETYQQILLVDPENENAAEGLARIERLPGLGASLLGR
jgi:tetratricopeptide (TPR) repeat protein